MSPLRSMIALFVTLAATKLEPGKILKNVCVDLNTDFEIEIQHDNEEYTLTVSVEALDDTRVYARAFGLNIYGTYSSQVLTMNGRAQLKNFKKGNISITIECTKVGSGDKTVHLHYTDSYLLRNNEKFNTQLHSIDDQVDTYFMVPVCHEALPFTINTTALVYASFDEARPSEVKSQWNNKGTNTTITIPADKIKIPGFLYLHFISQLVATHTYVSPYQLPMSVLTPDKETEFSLSSMQYCDDHFKVQLNVSNKTHLIIATADNDMQNKYSVPTMFMKAPFDEYSLSGRALLDRDIYNEQGVLDVQPSLYKDYYDKDQIADLGISIDLGTSYLPVTHAISQNYTHYNYSVYITFTGHYLYPGDASMLVGDERWQDYESEAGHKYLIKDTVMLFKDTSQLDYVDWSLSSTLPRHSDYVFEFISAKASHIAQTTMGQGQPQTASGRIFKDAERIVGIIRFDDNHTAKQGELTYARMYREVADGSEAISGTIRAEHSFDLKQHVEYQYNILQAAEESYVYGHFDPEGGNGMQLTITNMAYSNPSMTIYISQKDILPGRVTFEHMFVCDKTTIETCSFALTPDQVNISEKIYIGFMAKGNFQVITSEAGDVLTELFEYKQYEGSLVILTDGKDAEFENNFIFNPVYQDHKRKQLENEFTLVTVEMDNYAVDIMTKNKVDLTVSINTIPEPLNQPNSTQFSMLQGKAFSLTGKIDARKHRMVRMPAGQKIFITVACTGFGCGNTASGKKTVRYYITTNTISEVPETTSWGEFAVNLRSDGLAQSVFFHQNDEELAALHVFAPLSWGEEHEDIKCHDIQVNIYLCIGTHPDKTEYYDINHLASCFSANITTADIYKQFELDSSKDNVASGTVFAVFVPDYSKFKGNRSLASSCSMIVSLYKDQQISHFNKEYQATVFLGEGSENGAHFAADVPVITWDPASDSKYGDRMVLQFASEKKIRVCVTDELEVYYPEPGEKDAGQCTIYHSTTPLQTNELEINFKNYMNQKNSGNVQPTTRVYFTVWAEDEILHDQEGMGFKVSLTLVPQAYLKMGQIATFYFNAQALAGNDEYVSVAFDVKDFENPVIGEMSVIAGPDCNNTRCRDDTPDEFYKKAITTYVTTGHKSPDGHEFTLRNFDQGVQVIPLQPVMRNQPRKINTIYTSVEYRFAHELDLKKKKSGIAYSVYMVMRYGANNVVRYQSTTKRVKGGNDTTPIDQYHGVMPYNPSEIIIFPCMGKPTLLLDQMSPQSSPSLGDYKEIISGPWGQPIVKRFGNDTLLDINEFITVFDEAIYDYESRHFISTISKMQYELFMGSQAEIDTPGNAGQIIVTDFNSGGQGKVRVRFWPAKQPNQEQLVSQVSYRMYVVPYMGSFNEETDYSPYTSCGVMGAGYSIYQNKEGINQITVDEEQLQRTGYIEVESNMDLWQFEAKKGSVLFLTILAGEVSYQGVLAGDGSLSIQTFMTISLIITIVIAIALFVIFWALFVRVKLIKAKGYKQQLNDEHE